jgi:hypothetical protein
MRISRNINGQILPFLILLGRWSKLGKKLVTPVSVPILVLLVGVMNG